jgi:hypothetical protein
MTLVIRPRADWQLAIQPVTGPSYSTATIVDVVYHYPGSGANTLYTNPIAVLRAMQADYLRNRGYSLGYNYVVDRSGVVWEVRGVDIRSAATGGYNNNSVAVQFMVPGQQGANEAQLASAVELHHWLEHHHGRLLGVAGHFQRGTTPTPCPGSGVKAQLPELQERIRDPAPQPPPRPLPPPGSLKGTHMFVASWHTGQTYLVQVNLDGSFAKREITGEQSYLHLIGAKVLPFLDDRNWDAWLTGVPEV